MIYPRFNVLRSSLEINLLPSVSSFASDDNEDKDDDFAAYHWHHLSKIFPTKRFLVPRTSKAVLIRKMLFLRKSGISFRLLFQEGEKRRRANDPYLGVSLILAH